MDFDLFISSLLDDKESYDLKYKSAAGESNITERKG